MAGAPDIQFVIDASAVLALVLGEDGADWVESRIRRCGLSVVNLEEVLGRLVEHGANPSSERADLERLGLKLLPFSAADAVETARLRPKLLPRGMSLGDRACVWTAKSRSVPVVTADGAWTAKPDGSVPKRARLEGVTVLQIRPRGPPKR